MSNKDFMEQSVIACVNKQIGTDFKKLHRAAVLIDNYKTSLEHLKENVRSYAVVLLFFVLD